MLIKKLRISVGWVCVAQYLLRLAIIPMMEGVEREHAQLLFDVAFAVVILFAVDSGERPLVGLLKN